MIKAVLIDIDNTLLDFDAFVKKTLKDGFEHFQLGEYKPYLYDIFEEENGKIWRQLEKKEITFDELQKERFHRFFSRINIPFDGVRFEKYFRDTLYDTAILECGAKDMVEYLYAKYELYIASNGPFAQQKHRIELSGLSHYFKDMYISGEIGASKPSRDFFDEAMRRMNQNREIPIKNHEVIIIGDSLTSDMAGGVQAGMQTCFYNKAHCTNVPKTINFVVDTLDEVQKIM